MLSVKFGDQGYLSFYKEDSSLLHAYGRSLKLEVE